MAIKPRGRKNNKRLISYGQHLVYAEGGKTEPNYIENIKKNLENNDKWKNASIEIIIDKESAGRNTLSLIEYAEKDVSERLKKNLKIEYVWIFYDRDDFEKDDYDNAYKKLEDKNKKSKNDDNDGCDNNGIRWMACWSNPCFELWYLLHFYSIENDIERKDCIAKLNNFVGNGFNYKKNMSNPFDFFCEKGNIKNAYKYAKKLHNQNNINCPSTGVFLFLNYFDKYLDLELK